MNCEECTELVYDYLDGTLDAEDVRSFEQALSKCEECEERLRQARNIRASLKVAPSARPIGDERRAAIMAAARAKADEFKTGEEPSGVVVSFPGRIARWALAAAAVLAGVIGYWVLQTQWERPAFERGSTQESVARVEQDLAPDELSGERAELGEREESLESELVEQAGEMDEPVAPSVGEAAAEGPIDEESFAEPEPAIDLATRSSERSQQADEPAGEPQPPTSAPSAAARSSRGSETIPRAERRRAAAPTTSPGAVQDLARPEEELDRVPVDQSRASQPVASGEALQGMEAQEDDSVGSDRGTVRFGSGGLAEEGAALGAGVELRSPSRGVDDDSDERRSREVTANRQPDAQQTPTPARREAETAEGAQPGEVAAQSPSEDLGDSEAAPLDMSQDADQSAPARQELDRMRAQIEAGSPGESLAIGDALSRRDDLSAGERAELFYLMAEAEVRRGNLEDAATYYQRSVDQGIGTTYGRTSYQRLQTIRR